MILGTYPCCDVPLAFDVEDLELPLYYREECPHCGQVVWHRLTREKPWSLLEVDFLRRFEVTPDNQVRPRHTRIAKLGTIN